MALFFLFVSCCCCCSSPPLVLLPTSGSSNTGPTEATAQIRTRKGSLVKSVAVTPKKAVRAAPAASPVVLVGRERERKKKREE